MRTERLLAAVLAISFGLADELRSAPGDVDSLDLQMVYTGFNMSVNTALAQLDGKIILMGAFDQLLGVSRKNVARINANGTLDTGFALQSNSTAYSSAVLDDGRVLVAGAGFPFLWRVNANGTVDSSFAPHPNSAVDCIAVQPDGRIIIGGSFTTLQPPNSPAPITRNHIARLNADGTLDMGFNPDANFTVWNVVLQPNGKIVIGGQFYTIGGYSRNAMARLNTDGTLDGTVFNRGGSYTVFTIALQPDGKVLAGGDYSGFAPGTLRRGLARMNADGTPDMGFDPTPDGEVPAIALQADGQILIGGSFTTLKPNGAPAAITRKHIARLNPDGTLDSFSNLSFNEGVGTAGSINGLSLQADGKVLVTGVFRAPRVHFARLLNDPATQTLVEPENTRVVWIRGGAAPEVTAVTFERSVDGGVNWTSLGIGTRIGASANWQITGLSLDGTGSIRARGRTVGGVYSGSTGLVEQVLALPMPAYQQWKFNHLGDVNAPDLSDPDHDSLVTLAEYGLGLLPEAFSQPPVVSVFNYTDGERLRMFVTRDPAHNDVTVSVEATTDLGFSWTTLATSILGAPFTGTGYVGGDDASPGVKSVEIRDELNLADTPRRFLRVRVTH